MKTIKNLSAATIEIKKSKFHSFLLPFKDYENFLNEIKKRHPKANHFVTAFRYFNSNNQLIEGCSDDGEPRGSSGLPTLKVLQGYDLVDVGVVIVRYFGGILLGVGGLARAYSEALKQAIKSAELIDRKRVFEVDFEVDYNRSVDFEKVIKKNKIFVIDRLFGENGVRYIIKDEIEKINLLKEIK